MADNNTIARPYAQAVFELANDAGALGPWSDSLGVAGQLLADQGLVEYLGNPEFNDERRLEFLAVCSQKPVRSCWTAVTPRERTSSSCCLRTDARRYFPKSLRTLNI